MSTVLLKKKEVAKMLQVSCRTIDRLVSAGVLQVIKINRSVHFQLNEIEPFIKQKTIKILRNDKDAPNFNDSSN